MKNNLDTPVAKQCRALYTKYCTRTYVRPIKSGPQGPNRRTKNQLVRMFDSIG